MADSERPNPEMFLRRISQESDANQGRGRLKIFFGYAAGVGKTYAMLKAAHAAMGMGIDTVIGYVEPHTRPQTLALLEGLEQLPPADVTYRDITLKEFDIDAAMARKPKLILVDELAHTNAKGSRHIKRYQDVEELLKAGIDVYTTVNVQHIESLNDIVESITGVAVRERIPDSVFEGADTVELMDIEPGDLISRLCRGEIYKEDQAKRALQNFFTRENLIALREISLRRTADKVNIAVEKNRTQSASYITEEHILLCLSSSPANAKVIRTAARMAEAFHSPFTALYVETPSFLEMSEENRARLSENMKLAEQLGAKIATVYGDHVPQAVSDYATVKSVSKIVIGRPAKPRCFRMSTQNFIDKLAVLAPNIEIYVIPNTTTPLRQESSYRFTAPKLWLTDTAKTLAFLVMSTLIGFVFYQLDFSESNIITVYILGVLFIAFATESKVYSAVSSILAVMAFNYFFTEPRFSLQTYSPGYPVTLLIMFISAFLTSTLAKRSKWQARQASMKAYRTEVLLETSQKLLRAESKERIFSDTAHQIGRLLERSVIFYPAAGGVLLEPAVSAVDGDKNPPQVYLTGDERAVAEWVFRNNKQAGATTGTLPGAKCLYMAIRSNDDVLAVVGIAGASKIDSFERDLLIAMLAECALAIEKEIVVEHNTQITMQARQEQLRANLLRAISHDLRTPLTGISGNANILMHSADSLSGEKKQKLYAHIYDDAIWLISLIENLLSISRISNGTIAINMEFELVEDVINEALAHVNRKIADHRISVNLDDDMLMAKMDGRLIVQVIINIIDNAIKYTPKGSRIDISAVRNEDMAEITIADDGEGVSDEAKEKLFEMFFTARNPVTDSRRGLGLGLALCKSIVSAHGGDISVCDNKPHGMAVRFTLQAQPADIRRRT